jgi:hypothetical protein
MSLNEARISSEFSRLFDLADTTITDAKGKKWKIYRYEHMMTPFEKLKSLPNITPYLKPGITFEQPGCRRST